MSNDTKISKISYTSIFVFKKVQILKSIVWVGGPSVSPGVFASVGFHYRLIFLISVLIISIWLFSFWSHHKAFLMVILARFSKSQVHNNLRNV